MPNVNTKIDKNRELVRARKERPDPSDYERYADIITAYRELLRMTALDEDIRIGRGPCRVPEDRDKLLKWVQDPKNLDNVAESFRRVCSGYVSTARLFCINAGPFYMEWDAVLSMLKTGYDSLYSVSIFLDISGRGRLSDEVRRLEAALETIKEVQGSPALMQLLAAMPTSEERMGIKEAGQDA